MKTTKELRKQSTFMKIVKFPIRALTSVKNLYVWSMTGCASRMNYDTNGEAILRRSGSSAAVSSRRSFDSGDDFSELIRASSVRSFGHKNEIDMLLHQQKTAARGTSNGLPKSSSVGMGRIDEEKAYGEDSVRGGEADNQGGASPKSAGNLLGRRSRTVAVGRRDML